MKTFWNVMLCLYVIVPRGAAHTPIAGFWRRCRLVKEEVQKESGACGCLAVILSPVTVLTDTFPLGLLRALSIVPYAKFKASQKRLIQNKLFNWISLLGLPLCSSSARFYAPLWKPRNDSMGRCMSQWRLSALSHMEV